MRHERVNKQEGPGRPRFLEHILAASENEEEFGLKRLVMVLIVGAVLFGVVGAASAENGSIIPWSRTATYLR